MKKRQGQQALFNELYRKILTLSFVFFLAACATPTELVEKKKIKEGMQKWQVNSVLYFRNFWDQITIPTSYREYFIKQKKEILSDDNTREVYYVFRNVSKKVTCGYVLCDPGNGILDKTFYNYKDAVTYIVDDEKIAAKKKPKKTITIVEDNKETEIPKDDEMMKKLSKLMEDYKKGKISKEEFASKKTEILK